MNQQRHIQTIRDYKTGGMKVDYFFLQEIIDLAAGFKIWEKQCNIVAQASSL
ncbi:MAG: hypothetical protein AABY49_13135 [Planctomycetota bacterium]